MFPPTIEGDTRPDISTELFLGNVCEATAPRVLELLLVESLLFTSPSDGESGPDVGSES